MTDVIRKYESNDLNAVMAVWESASRLAHPFLTDEFQDQVRHDIPKLYLPNAETWVLERDRTVVGFVALLGNEIGAIFVLKECQRSGAGRALLNKAIYLKGELEVEVFEANSIGRSFYEKTGFSFIGESVHDPTGNTVFRLRRTEGNES